MQPLIWYPGHELLLDDVVRAEGSAVFDAAGRRYVDLESGVWCTGLGHAHPRVLRVLSEQAARLAHTGFCYTGDVARSAAAEILGVLGLAGGRCVFLCSGSEAVEYGVRVARLLARRPLLLTMADSYFGAYGAARDRRTEEWLTLDWLACPHGAERERYARPCACVEAIPFDRVGGFLLEPGSSSGLVRFPPVGLVQAIAARVQGSGGPVVVNEVTTGCGRTGRWFGFEHYGLAPDVVALGKGIGNGYPVSVAAFGPGAAERLGDREVPYAQSHQNDPLGAAVAREVVRTIREEGLVERGAAIGARLAQGLRAIAARTPAVREVRARGLMIAVELVDGPGTDTTRHVHRELTRRGFLVGRRPGFPVLRIDPSLTVPPDDIEAFLVAFAAVAAGGTE
jgi:acetylornithine aminotransferase